MVLRMTKANGRKPLNVELSDEDRALLEGVRARAGHRSYGETIRALINHAAGGTPIPALGQVPLPDVRSKAPIPPKSPPAEVQIGPRTYKPGDLAKKGKR